MLYEINNFSCSEEIFELFNKKHDRKEKYKATTNHCQKECTNEIHRGSEQKEEESTSQGGGGSHPNEGRVLARWKEERKNPIRHEKMNSCSAL